MNLETFFSQSERQQIDAAVEAAEIRTAAEIVPVLTDASGEYDRAEDIFGLLLALAVVIVSWLGFQRVDIAATWGTDVNIVYGLHCIVGTILITFIIGAVIASKIWIIRRLFTPRKQMAACVARGARRAFHEFHLARTTGATGILIYISLFEHMVYVLGDDAVAKTFSNEDFAAVRDAILAGIKRGERGAGLCEGIRLCGEKLAAPFPIQPDDVNELPNKLQIFAQQL